MSLQFMLFFLYATLLVSDGRRFTECELAEELKKNNISDQHISTYVCIAKRVSNLYTDIISDNFVCYGIFQISSVYWCSDNGTRDKRCNIDCDELLNNDLTGDIRCIKTIHEIQGFSAWWPYKKYCSGNNTKYVQECF